MTQQSLITDEIRSWIGKETPPWTIEVTTLDVKRFSVATDDLNPLYLDEDKASRSRYGGLIAPPLFYMAPLTNPVPESELRADGAKTTAARLSLLEAHQARLHEQIALLRQHEKALAAKITTYRTDLVAQRASVGQTEGADTDE